MTSTTRTAAILNADIVGYSRHVADDPDRAVAMLAELGQIARDQSTRSGGTLIDFVGDNFMSVFDSSIDALRAAVSITTAVRTRNAMLAPHARMRFRMGIDTGPVIVTDSHTYVGDPVNIAARIQALAPAGGITVSERVYLDLDEPGLRFTPLGSQSLKNIAGRVAAYSLQGMTPDEETITDLPLRRTRASIGVFPPVVHGDDEALEGEMRALHLDAQMALLGIPDLDVVELEARGSDREVDSTLQLTAVRVGAGIRVYAQMVDWATVNGVWAQRWDLDTDTVLASSDEIMADITRAVEIDLVVGEPARLYRETMDGAGLDAIYEGWAHLVTETPEGWSRGNAKFEEVASMHPDSAVGPSLAAYSNWYGVLRGYAHDRDERLARARDYAELGRVMGDPTGLSHMVIAGLGLFDGSDLDDSLRAARAAAARRPTCDATFAIESAIHRYRGSWEEGVAAGQRAMKLSLGKPWYSSALAGNLWVGGRYREAAEIVEGAQSFGYSDGELLLIKAAAYQALGMERRARATIDEFRSERPDITVDRLRERHPFQDPELAERWFAQLADAGIPFGQDG